MGSCIFCKITKGEIPSAKIYEDSSFFVFLDINPVSDGHLLIVPKKHVVWMQEAEDETVGGIFKLAKKLMLALKAGMECDYVQVSVGGTDVPHFHVHLIPRMLNDGLPKFSTKQYKESEQEKIAERIIQAF